MGFAMFSPLHHGRRTLEIQLYKARNVTLGQLVVRWKRKRIRGRFSHGRCFCRQTNAVAACRCVFCWWELPVWVAQRERCTLFGSRRESVIFWCRDDSIILFKHQACTEVVRLDIVHLFESIFITCISWLVSSVCTATTTPLFGRSAHNVTTEKGHIGLFRAVVGYLAILKVNFNCRHHLCILKNLQAFPIIHFVFALSLAEGLYEWESESTPPLLQAAFEAKQVKSVLVSRPNVGPKESMWRHNLVVSSTRAKFGEFHTEN
jgi:hypothetical protein